MRRKVIRAFPIKFQIYQTIELPVDAKVIDVHMKDKDINIVAEVGVGVRYGKMEVRIYKLEDELDIPGDKFKYIGCVFVSDLHGHKHIYVGEIQ